jgi:hypothetical protein
MDTLYLSYQPNSVRNNGCTKDKRELRDLAAGVLELELAAVSLRPQPRDRGEEEAYDSLGLIWPRDIYF